MTCRQGFWKVQRHDYARSTISISSSVFRDTPHAPDTLCIMQTASTCDLIHLFAAAYSSQCEVNKHHVMIPDRWSRHHYRQLTMHDLYTRRTTYDIATQTLNVPIRENTIIIVQFALTAGREVTSFERTLRPQFQVMHDLYRIKGGRMD